MNYRSVDLKIERDAARRIIANRVTAVVIQDAGNTVEIRSPAGFHLASLSDVTLPDGERGTKLRYRTAIISSSAAHARRWAKKIRDTMVEYEYAAGSSG